MTINLVNGTWMKVEETEELLEMSDGFKIFSRHWKATCKTRRDGDVPGSSEIQLGNSG